MRTLNFIFILASTLLFAKFLILINSNPLSGDKQKRLVVVDETEVLKNLGQFAVIVEANKDAASMGVRAGDLEQIAFDILKQNKLPVVSREKALNGKNGCCLNIKIDIKENVVMMRLLLGEQVCLKRDMDTEIIGATTYSSEFFGVHNNNPEKLADAFESLLNQFSKNYLNSNR